MSVDLSTLGPVVVLGCGKMGSALLSRWLDAGMPATRVWVIDPHPPEWLDDHTGLHVNAGLPDDTALALIAVKPQMLRKTLGTLAPLAGGNTLFVSVVAGVGYATYDDILGPGTPIIRTVPNTPAAVGKGVTAVHGNPRVSEAQLDIASGLLEAVGKVVRLEAEDQLRLVTSISGCGPAYVFHLIEAMTAAGADAGLPTELALTLATETVAGAGYLAKTSGEAPGTLRENVTSPNGVTQAALRPLMDPETGFPTLMKQAVAEAIKRDAELANDA